MRIGLRILLGYFLVIGLAAWFVLNVFMEEVKPGVRATQEDTLVATAQLLAELVADDMSAGRLHDSALLRRMQTLAQRNVRATISGIAKETLDYRVYITDNRGIVVFDSSGRDVGKDYSRWNDVYLTLRGKYGARSTRDNPADDASSVMYVAAPVLDRDSIIGVLTVAKPNASVQPFIERSQDKILQRSAILLAGSLLIGLAFTFWLTRALHALQRYAVDVESGKKARLPQFGNNEIGTLSRALEAMRVKLEGKEYAEELMHTLAHEMKSPIAAIQGSAELLQEDMPVTDRQQFLANILEQNQRQKQLIDRLLALVKLEKQQQLTSSETIDAAALIDQVESDYAAKLASRQIRLRVHCASISMQGDMLLLRQAVGNLVDNAIDFTPIGGEIVLAAEQRAHITSISVLDNGPGVPEYALDRIFDRFYSLPRPDGAKSTGLGLPFVKEVALLHGGSASVVNQPKGGTCACIEIPIR